MDRDHRNVTALASVLISIGLALLDKRLDQWIDTAHLSDAQREQLHKTENELIEAMRVALAKAAPRIVSLLGRAIPNDRSTGNWG